MLGLRLATPEVPVEELVGDFRWFVEDFHPARQLLTFAHAGREALAAEPFLDQRWQQSGIRLQADVAEVSAAMGAGVPSSLNFIWHTSYCCSTLIAHALDGPGRNLALSEPLVLVSLAEAKRSGALAQGWQLSPLPGIVFRLLGRAETPGARVLVKPSNFANGLLPDAARLTVGKSLFLYSDLPVFLLSIAKSGIALRKYVRRLFASLTENMGNRLPWPQAEIFQMSDLEIAALAWHLQIMEFCNAMPLFGTQRAASLDSETFLKNPAAVLGKLNAFFDAGLDAQAIADAVARRLTHHSKSPAEPFDAERRREQAERTRRQLGPDLDRIVEWSYRACPMTPQGVPLPGALL